MSTPALLQDGLTGNIELANLLESAPGAFDRLVSDLSVSAEPVDLSSLGLSLNDDDDSDEDSYAAPVRELSWQPPRLSGFFQREVRTPPHLIVGESTVDDVEWHLEAPQDGITPFTATLGESAAGELGRVAAVAFVFDSDQRTVPAYPYHLNELIALSSGHGRTDLLKHAGDFDLDDEELEQLIAQLDEVLIVDGRSLWRMLKRKVPEPSDDEETVALRYDDLDWDAIRSHPKLAQYRAWDQRGRTDPTGLGILLESISDRFRTEVRQRRGEADAEMPETETALESLDDLAKTIDAEDEEIAEAEQAEAEHRRMSARTRTRRQFRSFVKRFVTGLTDVEFTRLVGSSVIVPSYVVFNHLCWKLAQLDLIDRPFVANAQVELWKFFWGGVGRPGYLATLDEAEQIASIDILDAHCAEAVLLASVHQAYCIAWEFGDADLVSVRDAWRVILTHDLGGIGTTSVQDAATVSGTGPDLLPLADFVANLVDLAEFTPDHEILAAVAEIVGCSASAVSRTSTKVRRGGLGDEIVDELEISDPLVELNSSTARRLFAQLARLLPEDQYLRVSHSDAKTGAYADYELDVGLWYDQRTDAEFEFDPPDPTTRPWDATVERLRAVAA